MLIQPPKLAATHSGLYSLAALATYVEPHCEVRVLDPVYESLGDALREFRPDIIGITSHTVTYLDAIKIMSIAREFLPDALRILGGVHISCLPESIDDVFDAGVMGDGEETLREIVRKGTRDNVSQIPGIHPQRIFRVRHAR